MLLIVKMGSDKYYEDIYPIADVLYRKDNGAVLKGPLLLEISPGINFLAQATPSFRCVDK